jgi:hypothetical protein
MNLNSILVGSQDPQRLTGYYTRLLGEPGGAGGDFRAAGATVVQEPYQPDQDPEGWIATFADPDDNDFQLLSPIPS